MLVLWRRGGLSAIGAVSCLLESAAAVTATAAAVTAAAAAMPGLCAGLPGALSLGLFPHSLYLSLTHTLSFSLECSNQI